MIIVHISGRGIPRGELNATDFKIHLNGSAGIIERVEIVRERQKSFLYGPLCMVSLLRSLMRAFLSLEHRKATLLQYTTQAPPPHRVTQTTTGSLCRQSAACLRQVLAAASAARCRFSMASLPPLQASSIKSA